ncbi:MAG: ABC transporter permease [Bacteroidetes bacterium]|nr:ABC transporter permease [Bacteroidota bacterium]
MIGKIAWRNILRNKRRSLILITSIVVGVLALVLTEGFAVGMLQQMLTNQIGADAGYMQIHQKGYQSDPTLQNSMKDPEVIVKMLNAESGNLDYSERLRVYGLVSSAYNSYGVSIVGIVPSEERKITTISKYITKGSYLSGEPGQILISESMAEKLRVGLGDKVVIMASRLDGSIGSEACRVTGMFETFNSGFDQTHVYIPIQTADQMLKADSLVSEFVINPKNPHDLSSIDTRIRNEIAAMPGNPGKYEVLTYEQMLPLLVAQLELYRQALYLIAGIIAIALIFGIIDTMLMSVMERTHEFGVSMAIGMSNRKIFTMVMIEALYLAVIGTAIGLAASYGVMSSLLRSGWDLSMFSASMKSLGIGSIIYPVLETSSVIQTVVIIPIVTLLGSVYPALKAIRLQPVEAIRSV